jgi:TnpA family transposase
MANPNPSLLAYPEFPEPLTDPTIHQLFTPTSDELRWVRQMSNSPDSRLGLLCWLKTFPILGRFAAPKEIPAVIVKFLAECAGLQGLTLKSYPHRTRVRHREEIRVVLGIKPWGDGGEALAVSTMERIVAGRTHLSDLINGAIDALVAENVELPALTTLRRLAGNVHALAEAAWLDALNARLSPAILSRLDALLVVPEGATESAFSKLCKSTKRVSRDHLDELLEQLAWLNEIAMPDGVLVDTPPARIDAWAEEARRLTATELREYTPSRRHALLCCLLRRTRATRLDDLVTMLVRIIGRIEARARADLEAWHQARRVHVSQLLGVLREIAAARNDCTNSEPFAARVDTTFHRAGGAEAVIAACDEHLAKGPDDWRPFLERQFRAQRGWLMRLVDALPLDATPDAAGIRDAVDHVTGLWERPADELRAEFDDSFLDPEWRSLVSIPDERCLYRRRQLEVAAFFELVGALKAGDIYVVGAADYGVFSDDIFPIDSEPEAVAQYLKDRGLPDNPKDFVRQLRDRLDRDVIGLERAVREHGTIVLGSDGLPITPRPTEIKPPRSAVDLAEAIQDRMPSRTVLEALFNADRWCGFTRHFGPPGRLSSQIDDRQSRNVLTTFAIGSGLGPTQACRHFDQPVSPHLLSFVHRRHMGTTSLRAAISDILNIYATFELPTVWGPADKVAADGSMITTYDDNIQASYHIRYGRTGGVAYRHVGTNYIAYFTHFIAAGAYEGVYLFDGLQKNTSVLKATGIYSDTHGQSAALHGVAYLFGVELLPRIRRWRSLKLYRSDMTLSLPTTAHLYSATINWDLIESHWKEYLRVALAVQTGRVAASWILTRLNSYSRRNRLYRAFQELGRVLRTCYLLRWIDDYELRRTVTHEANKGEHYHDFAAYLNFGSRGVLRTNSRVDQEKAVIANQLVANAVILQTVADQTRVIQQLKREGYPVSRSDAKHLSPLLTRHLLRFGKYPKYHQTEPLPDSRRLDP